MALTSLQRGSYDSEGAEMIPDSVSPFPSRRSARANFNPDHDIQDRYAGPGTIRSDHYRPRSDDWRPQNHDTYRPGDVKDNDCDWQRRPAHVERARLRDLEQTPVTTSKKWVRPDRARSDKRLSSDASPHVQGQVQRRVSSDLEFDFRNVPKGPARWVDKGPPHIFIPSSSIPPSDLTVPHLFNRIKRIRHPSVVQQDQSGYYIFFRQQSGSAADLQACFDALNGQRLFNYTMKMQLFHNGQDTSPADAIAGRQELSVDTEHEPYSSTNRPRVTAEPDYTPRQLKNVPVITHRSGDLPISKAASPTRYTPSESSSQLSATHPRKCQICKKTSPLLIACSTCKRMYHKGCHTKPAVLNFNMDWQCHYCSKKKTSLASPMMDMAVSNVDTSPRPDVEDQSPRRKRARLTEVLAPETALSSAIEDAVSLDESSNNQKRLAISHSTNVEIPPPHHTRKSSGSPYHNGRSAPATEVVARVACPTNPSSEFPGASTNPQQSVFCFRQLAAIAVLESGQSSLPFSDVVDRIARQIPDSSTKVWRTDIIEALVKDYDCKTPLFWLRHRHGEEGPERKAWCGCPEHATLMEERPHLVSVSLRSLEGPFTWQQETDVQGSLALQHSPNNNPTRRVMSVGGEDVSTPLASSSSLLAVMDKTALPRVLTPKLHNDNIYVDAGTTKLMYESKMAKIRARPSRKQIFGIPYASRLGKSTAKDTKLHLPRQASVHKPSFEDGQDRIESFDSVGQLLDLPEVVVPMVFKERLAFRDANQVSTSHGFDMYPFPANADAIDV